MSSSRRLLYVLQLLLAGGIVYWLVATGRLQVAEYRNLLDAEHRTMLAVVVLAQLVSLVIYVGRWWGLARVVDVPASMAATFRTGFRGLFLGLVLPGSIGIDGMRLLYVRQEHRGRVPAGLASVLMDRLTGYVGLLVLAVAASGMFYWTTDLPIAQPLLAVNVALLVGLLTVVAATTGVLPVPGIGRLRRFAAFGHVLDALRRYRNHKSAILTSVGLAIVMHLFTSISWYCSIVILGDRAPLVMVVAITSILTIVRTVPITPLGLGVTDGLAEELYRVVDVSSGAEAQMLIRLVIVLITVAFGLSFLRSSGRAVPRRADP